MMAIVFAAPAGWLANKIGAVPCVAVSTVALGVLYAAFPLFSSSAVIIGISPLLGLGLLFYAVADMSLILDTLPNVEVRGRDIGVWNGFQYVGQALGAAFAAPTLAGMGHEPASSSPFYNASNADEALPYTRASYRLVFWVGAAAILGSCVLVYLARLALRVRDAARGLSFLNEHNAGALEERTDDNEKL
jgi:MFS family permease